MKKIVLALAVVATVACVSSCTKMCTCRTYVAGNVQENLTKEVELDTEHFNKCSDMNTVVSVLGLKTGMECE